MNKKTKNPPRRTPEEKQRARNQKLALQVGGIVLAIAVIVIAVTLLQPKAIFQNVVPVNTSTVRQHEEIGTVEFITTMEYEGLTPGESYRVEASLTDGAGHALVFGEAFFMTANNFVPEQESGSLDVILIIPPYEVTLYADEISAGYITQTIKKA